MSRVLISPSLLSSDFGRLAEEVRAVEAAGADWIHVDVMDGRFVPNITLGPVVVEAIKRTATRPLDVHLMIVEPEKYIEAFAKAGADVLTVHAEACPHLHRMLQQIRQAGAKPAVVLNPSTPLSAVEEVLGDVDMVLLMSVNPGFGGQSFIERTVDKVRRLRAHAGRARAVARTSRWTAASTRRRPSGWWRPGPTCWWRAPTCSARRTTPRPSARCGLEGHSGWGSPPSPRPAGPPGS